MAERQVKVGILITARDLASKVLRGIRGSFANLRNSLFSLRTVFTALIAGVFARGIKSLFNLGAEAEETASKFNTVFGAARGQVQEFLDTFGVIAGLSREQGQALSSVTGQIVQGLGFAQKASAEFSTQVVRLAADLASFNNTTTPDALEAVNSALTGITVPLKQYGIVLRESDIQQRALANTGKATEAQLTKQEKATAALQLITEAAGVAIGDMERTQDSMANTAKRISSQLETLRTLFGEMFVEAIRLAGGIGGASTKIQDFTKWITENREAIAAWVATFIKGIGFSISVLKSLVRVAFNVGEAIGEVLNAIFEELVQRGKGLGQIFIAFMTRDVNKMKEGLSNLFTLEDSQKRWDQAIQNTRTHIDDIGDAANDTAQAFVDWAVAGEHAAEVTSGAFKAGTGPAAKPVVRPDRTGEDAEGRAREIAGLAQDAETLAAKFKVGLISANEFRASLDTLVPTMMRLRDSGKLNDVELLKMISSIEMLREVAVELAQQGIAPIEIIDPAQVDVVERLSKGLSISLVRAMGLGINMIEEMDASMQNLVDSTLMGFSNAFSTVLDAIATQGKISGAELAKGLLLGIAKAASAEAGFFFARGIAALAASIFPFPNPALTVSAGQYFQAAALMAGVSAAAGLAASSIGGRGGGGGGGGGLSQADSLEGVAKEPQHITLVGDIWELDPGFVDKIAVAFGEATGRDIIIERRNS